MWPPSRTWLNIYDASGNLKARIFEYLRVDECTIRSNTFGILRFLIHQDAAGRDQLIKRYWIEVYRDGDTVWSGIICHVRKTFDEAGDPTRFYEILARNFEWLPCWRVIVPPAGQDYLVKSGAKVDDAVKYMVREQMETGEVDDANRALSGFSVEADDTEHGDTKTLAARYESNLGDLLFKWASAYDFDWWVEADCPSAAFVFRTKVPRRGTDKSASVIFTVGRHNLVSLEYYEDDLDTSSLCYVGGPGEKASQVVREVYDGAEPTGWDRREKFIPMANAEYVDELDAAGHAWLDSFGDTLTGVRFKLTVEEAAKWPDDFDIGDVVTVYDADFGVDKAAEIKEVNLSINEDGVESVELLVGEPQPTQWQMLQAGIGPFSSFDDDSAPATPTGLNVTTGTRQDADGHWHSYLNATWNANSELDVRNYEIKWTVTSTRSLVTGETSHYIFPVDANTAYSVQVRAIDRGGNKSAYCAAETGTTARDTVAPATPANLTVTAAKKAIRIKVDKNTEGDWAGNEFHVSTSNGFTPGAGTLVHSGKSTTYTYQTASYVIHYVRVRAYDTAVPPNYSAYTAQGSATPEQIAPGPDIPDGTIPSDKMINVEWAKIVNAAIVNADIVNLSASKIIAGNLTVAITIAAGGYFEVSGQFKIDNTKISILTSTALEFQSGASWARVYCSAAGRLNVLYDLECTDIYCARVKASVTVRPTVADSKYCGDATFYWYVVATHYLWTQAIGNNWGPAIVCYDHFQPDTDNTKTCGAVGKRWSNGYFATVTEGDHCFEETACPICNEQFRLGDGLVYYVIKVGDETRAVPAHAKCVKEDL